MGFSEVGFGETGFGEAGCNPVYYVLFCVVDVLLSFSFRVLIVLLHCLVSTFAISYDLLTYFKTPHRGLN